MKTVKIICRRYCPGEAWTNRMLCYARGLVEANYNVFIVFLISDSLRSQYELPLNGVKVIDLWKDDSWLSKKSRIISYLVNLHRVHKIINDDDIVLMFDGGGIFTKQVLRTNKKCTLITEITEHPDIIHYSFLPHKMALRRVIKSLKRSDVVFAISHPIREYLIKEGISENKIKNVNIFVDLSRFAGLNKVDDNKKSISYCGTISYQKDGVDILIKAFASFHSSHPDYRLVLYGVGENESIIPELKTLAKELHVFDDVVFKGRTSYENMPQELYKASILALSRPSNKQNENGFPTKLGEYLATANPVVATSVGDIPLFIQDGVNGYLATPGDVSSFANKLSYVADNYNEARKVGECGRRLAYDEFSYVKVASLFNQLGI